MFTKSDLQVIRSALELHRGTLRDNVADELENLARCYRRDDGNPAVASECVQDIMKSYYSVEDLLIRVEKMCEGEGCKSEHFRYPSDIPF